MNNEDNKENTEIEYVITTCKLPIAIYNQLSYESRYTGISKDALICIATCHFLAMQEKYKID